MNSNLVIEAKHLTKLFGDFCAVDHIDFEVREGEVFGFLGANGAGKTTAIKMLTGLSKPSSGEIIVAGYDVNKNTELVKQNIGYMSQKFSLYDDLTVKENIRFFGGVYGLSRNTIKLKTRAILQSLNLEEIQNQLTGDLPLGWKQKLAFSIALIHDPKIVFLDEPTSGVDPITRRQFWEMIHDVAQNGVTILVTTHYMDEAEYCDRMSIMVDGKIAALGTAKELKKKFNADNISDVFIHLARK